MINYRQFKIQEGKKKKAAFFDIDEFIYIKNNKSVPEFLNDYKDVDALYINWRLFGDSGLKCVENGC